LKLLKYYLNNINLNLNRSEKNKVSYLVFEHYVWNNRTSVNVNLNILSDTKRVKYSETFNELFRIILLDKNSKENEPYMTSFYLLIYKKYYLSKILKTPIYFKSFNIQDIIPEELLSYMMYSIKAIK
jgi:hypothetical protein